MNKFLTIIIIIISFLNITLSNAEDITHEMSTPMSQEDVIALSKSGLSNDVIIGQMKATRSTFFLSNEEIIALKEAGVSNDIIAHMVSTSAPIPKAIKVSDPVRVRYYYQYDPWYDYWRGDSWYDQWSWRHRHYRRSHRSRRHH